jgi:hypothetical protein
VFFISINDQKIRLGIQEAMKAIVLDRMPTSRELRDNNFTWLDSLIGKSGGLVHWAKELNLSTKNNRTEILSDSDIEKRIVEIMDELKLDRMPSSSEINSFSDGGKLHNSITRSYGYREWAYKLNLSLKDSETQLGNDYEAITCSLLREKGYQVEKMSTNHPFDVLINNSVKVDVKTARPSILRGSRVHAFGITKKHGSCDLYITVALNEEDEIEKFLIIPSHRLQVVTLCIGQKSKYDVYNQRFDLLDEYSKFFSSVG